MDESWLPGGTVSQDAPAETVRDDRRLPPGLSNSSRFSKPRHKTIPFRFVYEIVLVPRAVNGYMNETVSFIYEAIEGDKSIA